MKTQVLRNMPVVSMADGAKVGNVEDVLFDAADLRVVALLLRTSSGQSLVPFASVSNIGADAVIIESTTATEGAAGQTARDGLRGLDELTNLPVVNGEGTILGEVTDLEFAPADGRLSEIDVHSGGILGIGVTHLTVAASSIRRIGPKLITVDVQVAENATVTTSP